MKAINKIINESINNLADSLDVNLLIEGDEDGKLSDGIKLEANISSYINTGKFEYNDKKVIDATLAAIEAINKTFHFKQLKAEHTGAKSLPTSEKWINWGARDGTPKTDVIVSGKNISLKFGDAQIVSPAKGDALAICMAACEKSNVGEEITNECTQYINKYMKTSLLDSPMDIRDYDKIDPGSADDKDLKNSKIVKKLEAGNKKLDVKINSLFNNNIEFKKAFFFEAISGQTKFEGQKHEGKADYLLAVSKKADSAKVWKVKELTDVYGTQFVVEVSLKSNSQKKMGIKVGRRAYTTLRAKFLKGLNLTKNESFVKQIKSINENDVFNIYSFNEIISELYEKMYELQKNKNRLNENVLVDMFNWLKDNIKSLIDYAVNFIKQSFTNLVEFFDITFDINIDENSLLASDIV